MSQFQFGPLSPNAQLLTVIENNNDFSCELYEYAKEQEYNYAFIVFTSKNKSRIDYAKVGQKQCFSKSVDWCKANNYVIVGSTER